MTEQQHYTLADALELAGVYKQEYKLKILEIFPVKTTHSGKTVQDLLITDGTAATKYSVWNPSSTPQFKKEGGMIVTGAYIKPNDAGYYSLRIAKMENGGSIKYTDTSDIVFDYEAYKAAYKAKKPMGKSTYTEEDKNNMTDLLNYCLTNPQSWEQKYIDILTTMRTKGYLRDE